MASTADLSLVGFGTGSGLQLTVEGESSLRAIGFALSLNAPPLLSRYLGSRGVELQSLDEALEPDRPWDQRLLNVADTVLRQMELDPPTALLLPGNPLFLNPLSRFLVSECRARVKTVSVVAAPSELDVVVNTLGLDVGRRGLGLIDAAEAVEHWPMPLSSPVVLLKVAALAQAGGYVALGEKLRKIYPLDHPVSLVNVGFGVDPTGHVSVRLADFEQLEARLSVGSCLYLGPAQ